MKDFSHRRLSGIIIGYFLVFQGCCLLAQNPHSYNLSIQQGLPSAEVYSLYQDKKGFIWFATDNGVVRFDGSEMETYTTKNGLIDPVVFGFFEDDNNRLWFRTYSGNLSYFQNGEIHDFRFNENLSQLVKNSQLYSISLEQNNLWFSTGNLIGKIDSTGLISTIPVKIRTLTSKKIGDTYLLGVSGISNRIDTIQIEDKKFKIPLSDTTHHSKVVSAVDWRNHLYFGINSDIFKWDGVSFTKVFTCKAPVITLYVDSSDNLWIGYMHNGLEKFKDDRFINSFQLTEISQKSVTNILEDEEKGIWLSTLESGVFFIPSLDFQLYSIAENSKITSVSASEKIVAVADQRGAVRFYDAKNKKVIKELFFKAGPVLSLFNDRKNRLWIADNNIHLLDTITGKPHMIHQHSANAFTEDENFVWSVGGLRLSKYSKDGEMLNHQLTGSIHRSIFIDDTLIYVSERVGLYLYDKEGNFLSNPSHLNKYKITKVSTLNDSTLLLATIGNGLLLMNDKAQITNTYNTTTGFCIDNVYACVQNEKSVWLGTERGIVMIDKENLNHGKTNIIFRQLTEKGGLKNDRINFLTLVGNEVWAFSDEEFTVVPQKYFYQQPTLPTFYLKKILINDEEVSDGNILNLPYFKNNIQLWIGFIGFNHQVVACRYKINQGDSWRYTSNRIIQLPSLATGEYAVKLEYSVDNSEWIKSNLNLNFEIQSPFWKRWYFIASLIAIALGMGYVILWFREKEKQSHINQLYLHQQKLLNIEIDTLERERSRISKDLHDGIGIGLVVLKMKIHRFISTHNHAMATEVENQFQETITEIRKIIFELTPPGLEKYGLLETMQGYVEKLKQDTNLEIEYHCTGTEYKETGKATLIFRIIQELISNSVKHSQSSKIVLDINSFDQELIIIYQDNGIGFSTEQKKTGHGLDNIEFRIKALEGIMQMDSGDFGTSFIITIPKKETI
jgi:signal transduction histidine kinase/ligand-binding sensor domain-containing protein